jgi:hypothetical protein
VWAVPLLLASWWVTLISGFGLSDPQYRWAGWLSLAIGLGGSWCAVGLMTIRSRPWRLVARVLALSLPAVEAGYGFALWLQNS